MERQTSADLRDELDAERQLRAEEDEAHRYEIDQLTAQHADALRQVVDASRGGGTDAGGTWEARARELEAQVEMIEPAPRHINTHRKARSGAEGLWLLDTRGLDSHRWLG